MSKDILGSLVRVLVTVPDDRLGLVKDFANKLAWPDDDTWVQQGKSFLRKKPCWTNGNIAQVAQPKPTPSILELISTVVVPATTEQFVVKEKFVVNIEDDVQVKISSLWDNFTVWFLSGDGKIEDPKSDTKLYYRKLLKMAHNVPFKKGDRAIISEFGGKVKVETTLTEMFFLMEKQKNCEDGFLLNNGWANIFYIRDQKGVLRAVSVRWRGGGWDVDAYFVGGQYEWDDGDQVFSRNPTLESSEPSALA